MSTKQLYEKTSEGMKEVSPLVTIEDIYSKLSDTPLEALISLYNHVKCEWKGSVADTRRTVPLFLRRSGLFITYNNGTKYITEFFSAGTDQITTEGWVKDSNWTPVPDEDYISAGVKPGVGTIGYEQLNDNLKQLFREKVNVTNFPDDEDIISVDNMLKLKDREVDVTNFQSKGYVILRKNLRLINGVVKNILTQDMINQSNTIYVIRYDFNLGEDITIPANCVLKFDGGSINGNGTNKDTITGDNIKIESESKCFSNIKFAGNCINCYFRTHWFVNIIKTKDYQTDVTSELQALFNSNVRNIVFDDGFYYVTNTLSIESDLNIYTDHEEDRIIRYEFKFGHTPVIYSSSVITIIDYKHVSDRGKFGLYIGAIQLSCEKDFTDVTEQTAKTPIFKIWTGTRIWRCDIYASVRAKSGTCPTATQNVYNYTGIGFYANNSEYISMVRCYGEINDTYFAYAAEENNTWFTDFKIAGNTCCVKGIDTDIDGPLFISGSHQRLTGNALYGNDGYFCGKSITFTGIVWDINDNNSQINGTTSPSKVVQTLNGNYFGPTFYQSIQNWRNLNFSFPYEPGKDIQVFNPNSAQYKNYLNLITQDDDYNAAPFIYFTCEVNGNNIFTLDPSIGKVYNIDNLFPYDIFYGGSNYYSQSTTVEDLTFIEMVDTTASISINCDIVVNPLFLDMYGFNSLILYASRYGGTVCNLKVAHYRGSGNRQDYSSYIEDAHIILNRSEEFIKMKAIPFSVCKSIDPVNLPLIWLRFEITYTVKSKVHFPFIGITTPKHFKPTYALNSKFRLPNIKTNTRKGFHYFDTTLDKVVYWTGTNWVDALGNDVSTNYAKTSGTLTNGNLAEFNSSGNIVDSGKKPSDFEPAQS